ncbi:MAG TPA: hypothetical protein VJH97_01720 [Candidatus Nanoarchaeia archaeon]|nr:hypothetical protein [Candidatus Nanoarchaeia archaeon]
MGFIKKDVNFILLSLVLTVVILVIGVTFLYQHWFSNLSQEYQEKVQNLERVTEELGLKKTQLANTTQVIQEQQDTVGDLSQRFTQVRDEKDKLEADKATLSRELTESKAALVQAQATLSQKETLLSQAQADLVSANNRIDSLQNSNQELEDDLDQCQAELAICRGT